MKKTDRRVRRTRRNLFNALISLILEKGYDSITVQDILDRADVGRSTFYAHYMNKGDLLVGGMNGNVLTLGHLEPGDLIPSVAWLFEHAGYNQALYRALSGSEGLTLFTNRLRDQLQVSWEQHISNLKAEGHSLSMPPAVAAQFLSSGLVSLLIWWMDQKQPFSVEEMSRMFVATASDGLFRAGR